jgi:hypothetical protein
LLINHQILNVENEGTKESQAEGVHGVEGIEGLLDSAIPSGWQISPPHVRKSETGKDFPSDASTTSTVITSNCIERHVIVELCQLLRNYVLRFQYKQCCFSDIKPFLGLIIHSLSTEGACGSSIEIAGFLSWISTQQDITANELLDLVLKKQLMDTGGMDAGGTGAQEGLAGAHGEPILDIHT